jgi:hypothetical protein
LGNGFCRLMRVFLMRLFVACLPAKQQPSCKYACEEE